MRGEEEYNPKDLMEEDLSEMKDRLFVPLNSIWFDLFKSGEKKWELRGINNKFNEKTVRMGRRAELRKGYKGESLFGKISNILIIESSLGSIPPEIWEEVVPHDTNETDVSIMVFVYEYEAKYSKWILFKVEFEE